MAKQFKIFYSTSDLDCDCNEDCCCCGCCAYENKKIDVDYYPDDILDNDIKFNDQKTLDAAGVTAAVVGASGLAIGAMATRQRTCCSCCDSCRYSGHSDFNTGSGNQNVGCKYRKNSL